MYTHYEYKVYKSQNVHKQQIQSLQVTKCTEVVQGYDTNFGLSAAFKKAVLGGIKPKTWEVFFVCRCCGQDHEDTV